MQEEKESSTRLPTQFEDPYFEFNSGVTIASGRSEKAPIDMNVRHDDSTPTPPPFNPVLQTTRVLHGAQTPLVASAAGGGLASDEDNLTLPLHVTDVERVRPMLNYLVYVYDVEMVRSK